MSFIPNANYERVSEEVNGGIFMTFDSSIPSLESTFDLLSGELSLLDLPIDGMCNISDIAEAMEPGCVEPNEFVQYFGPSNSQNQYFECDNGRALMSNLPAQVIEKEKILQLNKVPIELSQSVGVGLPDKISSTLQKVQIVHPLETHFRPRYKSDYFGQNGKSRKPRYVADSIGNHYITLRVPIGIRGWIRIDWLTLADKFGDRYKMPYCFQQDNESEDVPDCNPMYIEIKPDRNGIMKVYLVLIKAKQDALRNLQPLVPFRPLKEAFGLKKQNTVDLSCSLNPKELIKKYQLDKSQLSFTYCAVASDGKTPIPEWDTTVYSTILNELPPKNAKSKQVTCPHCTHVFEVSTVGPNDDEEDGQDTLSNKRKGYANMNGRRTKKQKNLQNDFVYLQ